MLKSPFAGALAVGLVVGLGWNSAEAAGTWTQLGSDVNGEAAADESGYAVATNDDGSRMVIGAIRNDGSASNAGQARVFTWSGTAWLQLGSDIDGEAADDFSGYSVAMDGDGSRVAIGAPYNDGNGSNSGHVRVYEYSGGAWTQVGSDIDGEASGNYSGYSIALSGDGSRLAIGAPYNAGSGGGTGHVRVYEWNGTSWTQVGSDIDGEAPGDLFGLFVSLDDSGERLAIGAPYNDGNGTQSGHVRVFDWNGSAWTQVGSDIDGEAAGDESGLSVSLSGDGTRVAVGAHLNDGSATNAGHVRVFEYSGGAWSQVGDDIDGEAASDEFSYSVALNEFGTRVAVGARYNDGTGSNSGHARVYDWDGSSWRQIGDDIDGEAAADQFGYALALSPNGLRLFIGAFDNDGNGSDSGHVRAFEGPAVSLGASSSSSAASTVAWANFSFLLPDGRECTSISPQRVQVGTYVELPGVDANCHSMPGSVVAGWTIPVPPGFTGAGSSSLPLSPGHRVRVIESQRFTLVPFDPVVTIEYDANIAIDDACTPANLTHASENGRVGYSWVPRVDFATARAWGQAPCAPEGYELIGWNTAGDGSGESIDLGAPLPTEWETANANEHRLYAIWQSPES